MRYWLWLVAFTLGLVLPTVSRAEVTDFSFVQISDSHFPSPGGRSEKTIPALATLGEVELTPYGVTTPRPSFVIHTGDITEFGGENANAWNNFLAATQQLNMPVYVESGNHDSTWNPIRQQIIRCYGNYCYSFDSHGIHFIGLDTTGFLDPRPNIGEGEIRWLREDLHHLNSSVPVILFFHHPYRIEESACNYDWDRLADVLRPYNVILLVTGHTHSASHRHLDGYDEIQGGNTYQPADNPTPAGYNIISVQGNTLRVAYKRADQPTATVALLEKQIPVRASYPLISINQPKVAATVTGDTLAISATIADAPAPIRSAGYEIDNNVHGDLASQRVGWGGNASLAGLVPGAHYCRISFTDANGEQYHKSCVFYTDQAKSLTRWRASLEDIVRSAPLVADGMVYAATNNGRLDAFDARNGARRWTVTAGGGITGRPLLVKNSIIFGAHDGQLYAVTRFGKTLWKLALDAPIYSSPILVDNRVLVATASGTVFAIDPNAGKQLWNRKVANYTVESRPVVVGSTVYFGAWDANLYAINATDGTVKWGVPSAGAAQMSASKYYSPADSSPVIAGDRVFVADRNYRLSIMKLSTGELISSQTSCSAVGASRDGQAVYLRKTDGTLVKASLDGTPIWSVAAGMDAMPIAPVEYDGIVYTVSRTGLLTARSATDGTARWQYQVTPQLYSYAEPVIDHGTLYITGGDGSLTAIAMP